MKLVLTVILDHIGEMSHLNFIFKIKSENYISFIK